MDAEIWKCYREEAMMWAAKRDEAFQKSRQAHKRGDGLTAKNMSNYGKACGQECDIANKSAANAIFIQMNENRPLTEIDLHGLFVREAIERLEDRVIYALNNHMRQLDVIVGQGHHSKGGAKLKPSVIQFAMDNDIRYSIYEHNPGCIVFRFAQFAAAPRTLDIQNELINLRRDYDLAEPSVLATPRLTYQTHEPDASGGLWIIVFILLVFGFLKFVFG